MPVIDTMRVALLFLLTLSGCNPSGEKQKEDKADMGQNPPFYTNADNVTAIRYEDFTLFVEHVVFYDGEGYLNQVNRDTVNLYSELGEVIENRKIYVVSEVLENIKIEQRYQTTAGISLEGELCELHDWKHYESGWRPLIQHKPGAFTTLSYTEEEGCRFPYITPEEYREAIEQHCGGNFAKEILKITSVTAHPGLVAISKYYFRITGTDKGTGEKTEYMLTVNLPLSC